MSWRFERVWQHDEVPLANRKISAPLPCVGAPRFDAHPARWLGTLDKNQNGALLREFSNVESKTEPCISHDEGEKHAPFSLQLVVPSAEQAIPFPTRETFYARIKSISKDTGREPLMADLNRWHAHCMR
jgi:hypothetical protein